MKRLLKLLLSRTTFILLLLLAQIGFFFVTVRFISQYQYMHTALYSVTVVIVAYLIYKEENPVYKLSWIIPIMLFPLFGGLFYLFYRNTNISKRILQRYNDIESNRVLLLKDEPRHKTNKIFNYLYNLGFPTYRNTKISYLKTGPVMYEDILNSIRSAKSFIYLEFFIISPGQMWDGILNLLKEKVKQGISVKIIYDDFGSSKLPYAYTKKLAKFGIEAYNFNPMKPHLNFQMNYRDHRKIIVIDNLIGYTGGINIGDEYIDLIQPFRQWQDAGIKVEGDAVYGLYISFMNQLKFITGVKETMALKPEFKDFNATSFVTPFVDAPLDKEYTTKNLYIQMIHQAKEYISITTPYLIIDYEFISALKFAAKSGVKVDIIIPYTPDKQIVFMVTESYAKDLSNAGINIYKYKPGFMHQKMMIVDGHEAIMGTVNLDYRSLYLHFENSVFIKSDPEIAVMQKHFLELVNVSMNLKEDKRRNILYKFVQVILKGFSSIL